MNELRLLTETCKSVLKSASEALKSDDEKEAFWDLIILHCKELKKKYIDDRERRAQSRNELFILRQQATKQLYETKGTPKKRTETIKRIHSSRIQKETISWRLCCHNYLIDE